MRSLLAWLAEVLLGPKCRWCDHRGRGPRSLDRHERSFHPKAHKAMAEIAEAKCACHPFYHDLGIHAPAPGSTP